MRIGTLVGAAAIAFCMSGGAMASDQTRAMGEAFCKARLANDETATLALLSRSLVKAIDEAMARSDVIAKAAPGDKPPFGDGIPYQAFPDVPEGCEVGRLFETAGGKELEISYRFPSTRNADWTDRLKLVSDGDGLRIDDIIFANVANGEPDQGLRSVLFLAFDH